MTTFFRPAFLASTAALAALTLGAASAQAQYYRLPPPGYEIVEDDDALPPARPSPRYAARGAYGQRDIFAEPSERDDPRLWDRAPQRPRADLDLGVDHQETTSLLVADPTGEAPGTVVVDTRARKLYLVQPGGRAIAYGIGVGRQGFEWKGVAQVGRKAEWPSWTPPTAMLKRRPDLPTFMEGGMDNPLGARALYLFEGKRDTLFRIHGTNEPDTIGQAVSSGCIRMMNADVIDLYSRVRVGARVVVRG